MVAVLDLVCGTVEDLRNPEVLAKAIRPAIMSKQFGNEDFLAKLVADACSKCSILLLT